MIEQMQELMAQRPTRDLVVTLPDKAIAEYQEQGFTSVPRITTDEEIAWMRQVYDLLFSGELGLPKGALVNNVNRPLSQQERAQTTSQVLFPESIYPQLRETIYYRNSRRMAEQLIGATDLTCWGHMPRKAARNMEEVAWHQDEAYWDPHFDQEAAAFWMPLDDATAESGAMSFIPGSHKGALLRHGFRGDDPSVTALMLKEEIPIEQAVLHPIPAGGVSVHHKRAIHYSGPNVTDRPRRAYVNVWNTKPVERSVPYDRPWYWQKKEARDRHNDQKNPYYQDSNFADVTRRKMGG